MQLQDRQLRGDESIDLSVIVVSYNTRETTLRCLRELHEDVREMAAEVLVVDNASVDASPDAVRDEFPSVRLVRNFQNVGFGAANNQAMAVARGRFVMLLNSDAFVGRGTCCTLVNYLASRPEVGVVGPRLLNVDGTVQPSCYPYPSPARAWVENLGLSCLFRRHHELGGFRRWPHDTERDVPWVIGACLVVRREIVEQVGGFDEGFFMYAEETDWQRRIRGAGWRIVFRPDAVVTHLGGSSGGTSGGTTREAFFASLDRYELKHHGRTGLVLVRIAMILGCTARFVAWSFVTVASTSRRATAARKARGHLWLTLRQLTRWPYRRPTGALPVIETQAVPA